MDLGYIHVNSISHWLSTVLRSMLIHWHFSVTWAYQVPEGRDSLRKRVIEVDTWKFSGVVKKLNTDGTLAVCKQQLFIYWGKVYLFSEAKFINTKIHTLFKQFQIRTKYTFLYFIVFSFVFSDFFTILIFYSEIVKRKMNIQNFLIWRL